MRIYVPGWHCSRKNHAVRQKPLATSPITNAQTRAFLQQGCALERTDQSDKSRSSSAFSLHQETAYLLSTFTSQIEGLPHPKEFLFSSSKVIQKCQDVAVPPQWSMLEAPLMKSHCNSLIHTLIENACWKTKGKKSLLSPGSDLQDNTVLGNKIISQTCKRFSANHQSHKFNFSTSLGQPGETMLVTTTWPQNRKDLVCTADLQCR